MPPRTRTTLLPFSSEVSVPGPFRNNKAALQGEHQPTQTGRRHSPL